MKRILASIAVVMLMVSVAWGQEKPRSLILPGKGHIDVERLNKSIDLNMDISELTIAELRVLRNAFAARQGYIFMSSDLRGIFNQTSWYSTLMYDRWDKTEGTGSEPPFSYTKEETAFTNKLLAREKELKEKNFTDQDSMHPNVDNLLNAFQLEEMTEPLTKALSQQGFAIVPNQMNQLFQIYEKNDYHNFPSFITTDLMLQLFHLYVDCSLREAEQHRLLPIMERLCQQLYEAMAQQAAKQTNAELRDAAEFDVAFFAIALKLANPKANISAVGEAYRQLVELEVGLCNNAEDACSPLLGTAPRTFAYSLFRPRGHYTRNEALQRYFRTMMWLQTAPMKSNHNASLQRAALLARTIANNPSLKKTYLQLTEPITYLMGAPDNITILQVNDVLTQLGITTDAQLIKKSELSRLKEAVEKMAQQQTRIIAQDLSDEEKRICTINLMPQRYQPDAEVLQAMVDYDSNPTLRKCPKGLDIFAAMGWQKAEQILKDELGESKKWPAFDARLNKMQRLMQGGVDWTQTVTNRWLKSLEQLSIQEKGQPYFMLTPQWQKKSLNTALASWAELKHDAILYAKQPMGAECGAGGPPDPITKGYVEPNARFWQACIDLVDATQETFKRFNLSTERSENNANQIKEMTQFLLDVTKKELSGQKLTNMENNQIKILGSSCEYLSLQMLQEGDQSIYEWSDVQGPDRKISVVADVFTASAQNVPLKDKSILYEAVGPAYEIYVVVPIDGDLYLTRGAVFSYREFERAMGEPRWTDEEWQQTLEQQPRAGEPEWMQEIIVPLKKVADNETFFYSSGC